MALVAQSGPAWHGARHALRLPAWVVGLSLFGVGSLAHDVGFPLGATVLSTVLIWAGPAQAIFFASLGAGAAPAVAAVAIGLSSLRFLPMVMSILPLLRRPGQGAVQQFALAHCVAMTTWVEGLRRLPHVAPHQRTAYFLGFATTCILVAAAMTGLGHLLVASVPPALAAAILLITPLFFTLSLIAGARDAADWTAMALGVGLTPVAAVVVGPDFDLLATGLIGGSLAYAAGRLRRRAPWPS